MNETYKKLIYIVLSIGVVLGSYYLIVKPNNEATEAIERETKQLEAYLTQLREYDLHREEYIQWTAENYALFEDRLAEFPSTWNQEYQIEFIQAVRNNEKIDYDAKALQMIKPESFYVLGGAQEYDESGNPIVTDLEDKYTCYMQTMTLDYTGTYEGVKNFVNHVEGYKYRMTVDDVSMKQSNDDPNLYEGSLMVTIYSIQGKDRDGIQDDIDLEDIETGVSNLFTSGGVSSSVSKFASDNGEAIVSDYDIFLAVNPTSSDASGKLIGLKGGSGNITSSKNETETVSVEVSLEGETYVVQYSIGGQKERKEFAPGEDLTMLVQSSSVADAAADQNRVLLNITNNSDKTLYVKIADDASANRIKIGNRTGSVSVYR